MTRTNSILEAFDSTFPMEPLGKKTKLAKIDKDSQEEHPTKVTDGPENDEKYITEASNETVDRVSKKTSHKFRKTSVGYWLHCQT